MPKRYRPGNEATSDKQVVTTQLAMSPTHGYLLGDGEVLGHALQHHLQEEPEMLSRGKERGARRKGTNLQSVPLL